MELVESANVYDVGVRGRGAEWLKVGDWAARMVVMPFSKMPMMRLEVKVKSWGTFPLVQWLRLHTSDAGDTGLITGLGTKIPHAAQYGQNIKNNVRVGSDFC